MKRHKQRNLSILAYLVVLIGFFLMYTFIWPQSDVFLFAQATDGSFQSAWSFSLNYGNGRLLGNMIGVFFSTHFAFAGSIVAISLAFLVYLMNRLLFDNSVYTVFPLALLIALPSSGIITECYYLFAGFCNYVIPLILLLVCLVILKTIHKKRTRLQAYLLSPVLFLCGFSCCLFSENSTILAIAAALSLVIYSFICSKKITLPLLVNLASVFIGTAVMFLIPVLTGTGEKMNGYRQIASGLSGMIHQCVVSLSAFSEILNHCVLLIFLVSFAMILLCSKQKSRHQLIKTIQISIFALYPFLCLGLNLLDCHSLFGGLTIVKLLHLFPLALYICDILFTIISIEEKQLRLTCGLIILVIILSVAPMMIVSISGHRTYYTTYLSLLVFSLYIIKTCYPAYLTDLANKYHLSKILSVATCGCFAFISAVLLLLSVYNYDFYVVRSDYMAEKISCSEDLSVPPVPCENISLEDELENIIFFAFRHDDAIQKATISLSYWDNFERFHNEIVNNPIRAISFGLQNWHYKNPLYPESLCK